MKQTRAGGNLNECDAGFEACSRRLWFSLHRKMGAFASSARNAKYFWMCIHV